MTAASDPREWVQIRRARLAQLEDLEAQIEDCEVLAQNDGADGRRQWASVGTWLHRGERIAVLRTNYETKESTC